MKFLTILIFTFCAATVFNAEDSININPDTKATAGGKALWKFDFSAPDAAEKFKTEWKIEGKIGTKEAQFEIKSDETGSFLRMTADNASAAVLCYPDNLKPEDAPIIRWRWRIVKFPDGADGRTPSKDDQAIGIYIGYGNIFQKKSVSYRWDTETPVGSDGNCAYGLGSVKIKWFTLRDKNDVSNKWIVEERNWLDDFKKSWNETPDKIYISISCNSQYTGTTATADIQWIEFLKK